MCVRFSLNRSINWRQLSTKTGSTELSLKDRLSVVNRHWEDFIGITAVRAKQEEVIQCENRLNEAQKQRRLKQVELKQLQNRLKDIHAKLDRTSRGDDRFLHLLSEEHAAIKSERALLQDFEVAEAIEKETFQALSAQVRSSHEKERERVKKSKYLSLCATVTGTLVGIIGATIATQFREKRFDDSISTAAQSTSMLEQVQEHVNKQHSQIVTFIDDLRGLTDTKQSAENAKNAHNLGSLLGKQDSFEKLFLSMEKQNTILGKEMDELKQIIVADRSSDIDRKNVLYVDGDMQLLLNHSEKNIESKKKLQILLSVVFIYALAVVTSPLLLAIFKGD